MREGLKNAKYLIDFTRPEGTMAHLRVCRELGVNLIIGTTGFTEEQKAEIKDAAATSPSSWPQYERGVNVVLKLLAQAAKGPERRVHRNHRGPPPPQGRCSPAARP